MANLSNEEIKLVLICFFFGGGLILHALSRKRSVRKIEDTPRSKVASAPQGYVELQGFAWPAAGGKVERNAQGHETVYYRLALQRAETRGSGKNRKKVWVTVFSYSTDTPFYLIDATGIALIDPARTWGNPALSVESQVRSVAAKVTNFASGMGVLGSVASLGLEGFAGGRNAIGDGGGYETDLGTGRPKAWSRHSTEEKALICKRVGKIAGVSFPPSNFLFGLFSDEFRVIESEICVGSPLYVHGDFKTDSQNAITAQVPGLTEFASRVFNADARAQKNLTHFLDKDGDGKVSAIEAMRGYTFAARQARLKAKDQLTGEKTFEVHGRMGSSAENRLFIADLHEEHLVARKQRYGSLEIAAGILLMFASLFGFFVGFGEIGRQIASP